MNITNLYLHLICIFGTHVVSFVTCRTWYIQQDHTQTLHKIMALNSIASKKGNKRI